MNDWINIAIEYPPFDIEVLVSDGEKYELRIFRKDKKIKYWHACGCIKLRCNVQYWQFLPKIPDIEYKK